MIVAATGHRPEKLLSHHPLPDLDRRLFQFARDVLVELEPSEVISGMALGWDQAVAQAAISLRIPLTAACPFKGQERLWPGSKQALYREILSKAQRVVYVCNHGLNIAFQERNEWMVDRCDKLTALYDGTPGGTANCVQYATGWREIDHRWDQWAAQWVE